MKLSRTDLVPMLTIMAGGVLGASLSIGLLGSRSDNVSAPSPVVAPSATAEALRWNAEWRMAVERTNERARERMEVEAETSRILEELQEELIRVGSPYQIAMDYVRIAERPGDGDTSN